VECEASTATRRVRQSALGGAVNKEKKKQNHRCYSESLPKCEA